MNIAIIGAAGNLGSAIAAAAAARGHVVTPLGRATMDVTDPGSIEDTVTGHDAVVVAVKGTDRLVPRAVQALLQALPATDVDRLVFVGGGGSLRSPEGTRFVDAPAFPPQYLETARDQAEALDILRADHAAVRWSYLSPPPMHLVPGPATGTYRAEARETPITDDAGESRISTGDLAAAVLDALEEGTFIRQRFTVAY